MLSITLTHLPCFNLLMKILNELRVEIMDIVLGIHLKIILLPNTNHLFVFFKESYLVFYPVINICPEYDTIEKGGIALHSCSNTKHKITEYNSLSCYNIYFQILYLLSGIKHYSKS